MSLRNSSDNGALLPKVGEPDFFHFGMINRLTGSASNQMGTTGFHIVNHTTWIGES